MNATVTQVKTTDDMAGAIRPDAHHFCARMIDGQPALLEQSYRLRYQVYCTEREFLPSANYPDGQERDDFDAHAVHIAAFDAHGEMAGTVRLVRPSPLGLPMLRHCTLFSNESSCNPGNSRQVEIGRLAVSRQYRRRQLDAFSATSGVSRAERGNRRGDRRRRHDEIFMTMTKALYRETKRSGATHWMVATEKSLQRMLAQHGFAFRAIGPQTDYFGPVAPYQLDIHDLDQAILSGGYPSLADFLVGLEPEFRPRPASGAPAASDRARPFTARVAV